MISLSKKLINDILVDLILVCRNKRWLVVIEGRKSRRAVDILLSLLTLMATGSLATRIPGSSFL